MGLPRSTFYDQPAISTDATDLLARLTDLCDAFEGYGYRRVGAALRQQGIVVNGKKLRRLIREHGLRPRLRRRFKATTDSDHDLPLVVDHMEVGAGPTIASRPKAASSRYPRCEGVSSRVHSRYTRTLSNLPAASQRLVIRVSGRRFRCAGRECRTKVFAERLEPDLAAAYAQRTGRLETIVHHRGLALGGRPAESFACLDPCRGRSGWGRFFPPSGALPMAPSRDGHVH